MTNQGMILQGATALVGEGLEPRRIDVTVVGETIVALGGAAPPGAPVVVAEGLTLLPGFIDSHVHIAFYPPAEVLSKGVTTVRDLAWGPEIFDLVKTSSQSDFAGPHVFAAGQMLTVPEGYPTRARWAPPGTARVVRSSDDAPAAVADQADKGACAIKVALDRSVGPVFDETTLRAVVQAAHEAGLQVTAHIHDIEELRLAIDCGIDELAHMLLSGDHLPDQDIGALVSAGIAIVPTLSCFGAALAAGIENLARFYRRGGTVLYGTDLGNEGPGPGIEPQEIAAMAGAGMDGRSIIRSATAVPAARFGWHDRGVLAPGRRADILGVRGDPVADPSVLAGPELVIRGGVLASRDP